MPKLLEDRGENPAEDRRGHARIFHRRRTQCASRGARPASASREGYKGTADISIAAESGEVAGFCTGWQSFKSIWRKSLDSGDAFIAVQAVPKSHPDLPKVPLAISYAKSEEAKKLIQISARDPGTWARPFVLPPGTPKD